MKNYERVNLKEGWRAGLGIAYRPQDKVRRRNEGEAMGEIHRHFMQVEHRARCHVDRIAETVTPVASGGGCRRFDRLSGFEVDHNGFGVEGRAKVRRAGPMRETPEARLPWQTERQATSGPERPARTAAKRMIAVCACAAVLKNT